MPKPDGERLSDVEAALRVLLSEPVTDEPPAEPVLMFPIGELILAAAGLLALTAIAWLWLGGGSPA